MALSLSQHVLQFHLTSTPSENLSLIKQGQVYMTHIALLFLDLSLHLWWDQTQNTNAIELYSTSRWYDLPFMWFSLEITLEAYLLIDPAWCLYACLFVHCFFTSFIVPWISLSSYHSFKPNPPKNLKILTSVISNTNIKCVCTMPLYHAGIKVR